MTEGGFGNLMFPLWFALLGSSFVFLVVASPSILFLVFSLLWVLWFIYGLHSYIIFLLEQPKTPNKIMEFPPGREIPHFKSHSSWHQQYQIDKVSNVI
jgi:hypothetical protein